MDAPPSILCMVKKKNCFNLIHIELNSKVRASDPLDNYAPAISSNLRACVSRMA